MSTIFSNSVAFIDMEQEFWTGVLMVAWYQIVPTYMYEYMAYTHYCKFGTKTLHILLHLLQPGRTRFLCSRAEYHFWHNAEELLIVQNIWVTLGKGSKKSHVFESQCHFYDAMIFWDLSHTMVENSNFLYWLNGWNCWMANGWKF